MAVVERDIIAGGGGDYTTIAAWETATNLNSDTDIWKGVINDTSAYDERSTINGGGTSTSSYVWLTVDSADRHAGVWSTSKARISYSGGSSSALWFDSDYVRVDWLQVHTTAAGTGFLDTAFTVVGDNCLIDYCIIWTDDNGASNDTAGVMARQSDVANLRVSNSVIYGWDQAAIWSNQLTSAGNQSHTIDIDHCALAVSADSGSGTLEVLQASAGETSVITVYNTWISEQIVTNVDVNVNVSNASGQADIDGSHNAFRTSATPGSGTANLNWTSNQTSTDDITTTAPATAGIYITDDDHTSTFDATPIDHANNVLITNGTNRQGNEPDSRQDFSVDITGATRPTSNVDIGPFQISAAAGGSLPPSRPRAHSTMVLR